MKQWLRAAWPQRHPGLYSNYCKDASQQQQRRHFGAAHKSPSASASSSSSSSFQLRHPTIVHNNNHILVLNKPAGWHTVPNNEGLDQKCLLTYAKHQGWGGGSRHDFLKPLHRLDQPCTGLQFYGKTSKAASRIQSKWMHVKKTYICVLTSRSFSLDGAIGGDRGLIDGLLETSSSSSSSSVPDDAKENDTSSHDENDDPQSGSWHTLTGHLDVSSKQRTVRVTYTPLYDNQPLSTLEWKPLWLSPPNDNKNNRNSTAAAIVAVRTNQGKRHMIRALFSHHHCPIWGDLRYGAPQALPDQSVALHSYCIQLPTSDTKFRLGNSLVPGQEFVAGLPSEWSTWFGIEHHLLESIMSAA